MDDDTYTTILPLPLWIVLLIVLFAFPTIAGAEPFAVLTPQEGLKITLHNEDCRLGELVTNLPGRATWEEGGKVFEGCFGVDPRYRHVRLFFSDKTVVSAPINEFQKLTGV